MDWMLASEVPDWAAINGTGNAKRGGNKGLDPSLRQALKRLFALPITALDEFLFLPVSQSGAGVRSARDRTCVSKIANFIRLLGAESPRLRSLVSRAVL